jgi:hypothetical protein
VRLSDAQVNVLLCFNLAAQLLYWDTLGDQLRLFQALSDFIPERSRELPDAVESIDTGLIWGSVGNYVEFCPSLTHECRDGFGLQLFHIAGPAQN